MKEHISTGISCSRGTCKSRVFLSIETHHTGADVLAACEAAALAMKWTKAPSPQGPQFAQWTCHGHEGK